MDQQTTIPAGQVAKLRRKVEDYPKGTVGIVDGETFFILADGKRIPFSSTFSQAHLQRAKCKLVGTDGNAFAIIGNARRALREFGAPHSVIQAMQQQAMKGEYFNVISTVMTYLEVR